jgi:hypothetical protein
VRCCMSGRGHARGSRDGSPATRCDTELLARPMLTVPPPSRVSAFAAVSGDKRGRDWRNVLGCLAAAWHAVGSGSIGG